MDFHCTDLFRENSDPVKLRAAKNWKPLPNETFTDSQLHQNIFHNCGQFLEKQKYFLKLSNTKDEENFRIAFNIVVFKSASQVERLLRTIYRPWNYYCIHIDTKSSKEFLDTINELVKCLNLRYNNIFSTSNRVDVQWGKFSVLSANLNCMKELYEKYKDWKYLINLTGQEFPLKTNAELVKILKAYNGANNIGLYKNRFEDRIPTIKIPFPIVWFKGSIHITANRDTVAFMFKSPKSKILLDALKDRHIPDETFFSTLNHNSHLRIPGSFIGYSEEIPSILLLTRYKNWGHYSCKSGKYVRQICIWGVADLPKLVSVPHLFTNKLYENFEPVALKCLEKWYYEKVEKEIKLGRVAVNETFYSLQPFVKYQYIPPTE